MNLSQTISTDAFYWGIFILSILLVCIISILVKSEKCLTTDKSNDFLSRILVFVIILFITFCVGADKPVYKDFFLMVCKNGLVSTDYLGWSWLTYCISFITHSDVTFFFILAFVYVVGNYMFCKFNSKSYQILFVAVISFMGFYAYGVNTIKSGLGLSLLMFALCCIEKKKYIAVLFMFLAYEIHHSTLIPIAAFVVAFYVRRTQYCYFVWLVCIGLSLFFGTFFQTYLGMYLGDDDRYRSYLMSEYSNRYQMGYRYDFLIYSVVPVIWGYMVEKWGYLSERWELYFKTYIIANSFWVLVISIPFTDRVAYLSWFLIPYILLMPILDVNAKIPNRKVYLLFSFAIFSGFNIYQILLR